MTLEQQPQYWFAAKSFGWGWGRALTWQGWAAYALYAGAMAGSFFLFPPTDQLYGFLAFSLAVTLALVLVCWLKGEPPGWRWGGR